MRVRNERLNPGHMPYDPLNGLRVGAFVGAILGAVVVLLSSFNAAWMVLVFALAGGIIGYRSERRTP